MAVRVRNTGGCTGAEVEGVDLSRPLDPADFRQIEAALHDRGVMCFRGQQLSDEQHIAFSRLWGDELDVHPLRQYAKPEHPEVFVLSNILDKRGNPVGAADAAQYWHTDLSYTTHPSRVSILRAIEIPHDDDGRPLGETEFASTAAAYEALPDALKARLGGLRAAHHAQKPTPSAISTFMRPVDQATQARLSEVVHPVVRTHPHTGRKCLYVNWGFTTHIVGEPREESDRLLGHLFELMTERRFVHVHRWAVGDVLMWDNCSVVHQAIGNYRLPRRRLLYRTIVKGSAPF